MTYASGATDENHVQPLLMTMAEVAWELRCTPRHVQNLIARGELPAVRFGSNVRVARRSLEQLIETKVTGAP